MSEHHAGLSPTFWVPNPSVKPHRFALGGAVKNSTVAPLVAVGMNPSYADETTSDRTVNRIIEASIAGGYSGWIMLNLYPERATKPECLKPFNRSLSADNCAAIEKVLSEYGVTEVLGAWGNPPNGTIKLARADVLALFWRLMVKVFRLDKLTIHGEPRHPLPRSGRFPMAAPKEHLIW